MAVTKIDGSRQILAGSITNAEISASASIALSKLAEAVIQADGGQAFTADQSMGTHKLTNLSDGSASTDAVNKGQLDALAAGLKWKASVRCATTAAGTLATDYDNGKTIDTSVTLVTGDRILIKNQTGADEYQNGIYIVAASGAPTRATDADAWSELVAAAVFIEEGTANADTGWVCTVNSGGTLGTTAVTFAQFTGAGAIVAGNGLDKSGNTLFIASADQSMTINSDTIQVKLDATAGTIAVGGAGLQIADGTAGQILIGKGAGVDTAFTAISGDATLASTGALTLASNVLKEADYVAKEVPSGTINGVNTTFTLAATPVAGSEMLFLNGILQNAGGSNDYTISGTTITYNAAPIAGDVLLASYIK